jgi:hypothetical protein
MQTFSFDFELVINVVFKCYANLKYYLKLAEESFVFNGGQVELDLVFILLIARFSIKSGLMSVEVSYKN